MPRITCCVKNPHNWCQKHCECVSQGETQECVFSPTSPWYVLCVFFLSSVLWEKLEALTLQKQNAWTTQVLISKNHYVFASRSQRSLESGRGGQPRRWAWEILLWWRERWILVDGLVRDGHRKSLSSTGVPPATRRMTGTWKRIMTALKQKSMIPHWQ